MKSALFRPWQKPFCPSFALISVLALVSLAALTATAFLASARLESRANMSLQNSTRLEMALHAGSVAATELLDNGHGDQLNFITTYWRGTGTGDWTNELGYLLNGYATNAGTNTGFRFFACFSTATFTNLGNSFSETNYVSNNIANQGMFLQEMAGFMKEMTNFKSGQSVNIPLLGDTPGNRYTSPPVGWVYIRQDVRTTPGFTNTTNIPVVRFAFYVQDLGGLIDAQRNGATNTRDTGTNPEEISISNAWGTSLTSAGKASNLVVNSNRWKYLSPGMLTLADVGGLTTNDLRYVTTALPQWNSAWAMIPPGLGYADSTNFKYNIRSNSISMTQLVAIITNNLRQFPARSGAMNSNAYISNLAANIIDYMDVDSVPTVDSATNPTYLGIENLPWPNELFDRLGFSNVTSSGMIQLELKDWIEVWNMGNKTIPSGTKVSIDNNYDMVVTFTNTLTGSIFKTNLNKMQMLSTGASWGKRDFTLTNDLLPNGYMVLESSSESPTRRLGVQLTTPSLYATATIRNAWKAWVRSDDETNNMSFKAYCWAGGNPILIQRSTGGRWPGYSRPTSSGFFQYNQGKPDKFIFCNPVGYASQDGSMAVSTKPLHSGGDPRAQLFLNNALRAANFINGYASCGGRNVEVFNITNFPESEVNPSRFWPDNGHVSKEDQGSGPTGNSTTGYDKRPTDYPNQCVPENYVMQRNDTGQLTNLIELGNIYDPMQWEDQEGSEVSGQPGLWINLTGNAMATNRYGGRNTLRVGRWEFSRFAFTNQGDGSTPAPNMMMSSSALLDLFCLTDTNSRYDEGGRINLNTAPAPVLRALAGGIQLTNDPAQKPTNLAIPPAMAEAFAQGVMRFRSKYPFYSPSQLAFIGTDAAWPNTNTWPTNAVFGNTNKISLSDAPGNSFGSSTKLNVTEWNDQAAEEWFSKIYRLATPQSRNYRCYVLAQLVDEKGIPTGPAVRKYYNIFARNNFTSPNEPGGPSASSYSVYESEY